MFSVVSRLVDLHRSIMVIGGDGLWLVPGPSWIVGIGSQTMVPCCVIDVGKGKDGMVGERKRW